MKTCKTCKQSKPLDEYYKYHSNEPYLRADCKMCHLFKLKEWHKANPELRKAQWQRSNKRTGRKRHLKYTYGISLEEYQNLSNLQQNVCAICKCAEVLHKHLLVDHDHITKRIRGLLCSECNKGLGHFKDKPILLSEAIKYLYANTKHSDGIKTASSVDWTQAQSTN